MLVLINISKLSVFVPIRETHFPFMHQLFLLQPLADVKYLIPLGKVWF